MFANEKTAIFTAPVQLHSAVHRATWLGLEGGETSCRLLSLSLFQASGSQAVFSFSPLISFFFLGGRGRELRIWRPCFDAFSAPGLQSNFLVELCHERHLYLETEVC